MGGRWLWGGLRLRGWVSKQVMVGQSALTGDGSI